MTVLPLDIIETLADIIAAEDGRYLPSTRACSLVCRDFLPAFRKHIFASIGLNEQFNYPHHLVPNLLPPITVSMLHKLLSTSPEIANYITDLTYCIIPDSVDWTNPAVMQTFKKVTRLRSLYICDYDSDGNELQWTDSPLRPALLHLLHLPSLIKFRAYNIKGFLLTDLAPCINLEKFTFERLTTIANPSSNLPESPISIRTIEARDRNSVSTVTHMCTAQCIDGKPFIDFSKLTSCLMTVSDSFDIGALRNLLSRSERLIKVHVKVSDINLTSTGLSNTLNPSMQTLKWLQLSIMFFVGGGGDPLCGLTGELEHMGRQNIIEDLVVNVYIESMGLKYEPGDEWGRFDKVLAQSGWPKLRRVSLTITVNGSGFMEEALKELLQIQLCWLLSNKSLSFELDVKSDW